MISLPRYTARQLGLGLAGLLLAIALLVYLVRHRGDSDVLTAPVVRAIGAERVARPAVDSQIAAAWIEAEAARARKDSADARSRRMERVAQREGRRADSLAVEARNASTARDSAMLWHLAYASRTAERDTLRATIDTLRSGLTLARAEAVALRRGLDVADSARHRADSVLDATVAVAVAARCRVPGTFGLVPCMSRTHSALAGLALGAVGTVTYQAIRDGRIRIAVPLLR